MKTLGGAVYTGYGAITMENSVYRFDLKVKTAIKTTLINIVEEHTSYKVTFAGGRCSCT